MAMKIDSLELTDDVKRYACWASPSVVCNGKMYCLVGVEWIEMADRSCKECPYSVEG